MITISLCMIVKNEEETLPKCLGCVQDIVDEIIIVDTGSTDETKRIAAAYGARVFDFEWINDFSAARNYAFEQATMEYLFWLDADDMLLPEDIEKFKQLKETLNPAVDVVMMRYHTGLNEQGEPVFTYLRERLLKRAVGYRFSEPVHECVSISGNIFESDIAIVHSKHNRRQEEVQSSRNIEIYEAILQSGEELSVRGMYYYARELRDHGRLRDCIEWMQAYLDTGRGWIEDNIAACNIAGNCYLQLNEPAPALRMLLRALEYDVPRAETCCNIGYVMKHKRQFRLAAYWFEQALCAPAPASHWGFTQPAYAGYIPALELAVCYDALGEREKAVASNEHAADYQPDSPAVQFNRTYFATHP